MNNDDLYFLLKHLSDTSRPEELESDIVLQKHVNIKSLLWVQILVLTELKTFGFVKEKSCAGHVKRI